MTRVNRRQIHYLNRMLITYYLFVLSDILIICLFRSGDDSFHGILDNGKLGVNNPLNNLNIATARERVCSYHIMNTTNI